MSSFRSRDEIREDTKGITWPGNSLNETNASDRLECQVLEIHEGGMFFGGETAVFHVTRTDVDKEKDVPTFGLPTDGNVHSESWVKKDSGRKLYRILGELWRTECIEPSSKSPIIRGDKIPPTVFFITDSEGKQETRETLTDGGRWLWFRPEIVLELISHRAGFLGWYTKDTGNVGCASGCGVHFGINSVGLINTYAKDVALLPDWQQKIWSGFNVPPEGKVSKELLASQVDARPASTKAPEAFIYLLVDQLKELSQNRLGFSIIRTHHDAPKLIAEIYRFRVVDKKGLFSLAKDVTRLITDSIDTKAIEKIIPKQTAKLGSLKSLELLLSTKISTGLAKTVMGPLFGAYELRLADAHPASEDLKAALDLLGIDKNVPYVEQGFQLLNAVADTLQRICQIIEKKF